MNNLRVIGAGVITILGLAVIIISRQAISDAVGSAIDIFIAVCLTALIAAIVGSLLVAFLRTNENLADRQANRSLILFEADKTKAQAEEIRAKVEEILAKAEEIRARALRDLNPIITAQPGYQVYKFNLTTDVAKSMHLSPTVHTNGIVIESQAEAMSRWQLYQLLHAGQRRRIEAGPAIPGLPAPEMPQLLDLAQRLDRIMLVAGTGAGKTNFLKHYVTLLVNQGKRVAIVDPHSPSKLVGLDVIGANLDWEEIANYFVHTMAVVSARYVAGGIAQDGNLGHLNTYVIIEEFWDIHDSLQDLAVDFLKCLLVRARKAGFKYILVTQNDTADALGLHGNTGLLKGADRVEIKRDLQTDERLGIVGRRKSEQVECAVPGVFPDDGYPRIPAGQLVIDRPPAYSDKERAILRILIDNPGADKADIYRALGIQKNGPTSQLIDDLRSTYWGALGVH